MLGKSVNTSKRSKEWVSELSHSPTGRSELMQCISTLKESARDRLLARKGLVDEWLRDGVKLQTKGMGEIYPTEVRNEDQDATIAILQEDVASQIEPSGEKEQHMANQRNPLMTRTMSMTSNERPSDPCQVSRDPNPTLQRDLSQPSDQSRGKRDIHKCHNQIPGAVRANISKKIHVAGDGNSILNIDETAKRLKTDVNYNLLDNEMLVFISVSPNTSSHAINRKVRAADISSSPKGHIADVFPGMATETINYPDAKFARISPIEVQNEKKETPNTFKTSSRANVLDATKTFSQEERLLRLSKATLSWQSKITKETRGRSLVRKGKVLQTSEKEPLSKKFSNKRNQFGGSTQTKQQSASPCFGSYSKLSSINVKSSRIDQKARSSSVHRERFSSELRLRKNTKSRLITKRPHSHPSPSSPSSSTKYTKQKVNGGKDPSPQVSLQSEEPFISPLGSACRMSLLKSRDDSCNQSKSCQRCQYDNKTNKNRFYSPTSNQVDNSLPFWERQVISSTAKSKEQMKQKSIADAIIKKDNKVATSKLNKPKVLNHALHKVRGKVARHQRTTGAISRPSGNSEVHDLTKNEEITDGRLLSQLCSTKENCSGLLSKQSQTSYTSQLKSRGDSLQCVAVRGPVEMRSNGSKRVDGSHDDRDKLFSNHQYRNSSTVAHNKLSNDGQNSNPKFRKIGPQPKSHQTSSKASGNMPDQNSPLFRDMSSQTIGFLAITHKKIRKMESPELNNRPLGKVSFERQIKKNINLCNSPNSRQDSSSSSHCIFDNELDNDDTALGVDDHLFNGERGSLIADSQYDTILEKPCHKVITDNDCHHSPVYEKRKTVKRFRQQEEIGREATLDRGFRTERDNANENTKHNDDRDQHRQSKTSMTYSLNGQPQQEVIPETSKYQIQENKSGASIIYEHRAKRAMDPSQDGSRKARQNRERKGPLEIQRDENLSVEDRVLTELYLQVYDMVFSLLEGTQTICHMKSSLNVNGYKTPTKSVETHKDSSKKKNVYTAHQRRGLDFIMLIVFLMVELLVHMCFL